MVEKKKRILFRADGNSIAGYGHVIRSLSLAAMLKKKFECIFLIQSPNAFLKDQIQLICKKTIILPDSENMIKESKMLSKKFIESSDIVVLDGYKFDNVYQSRVRKACFKLVCIDDIYSTHFTANAVINHAGGINDKKYSVEKYTQLYLGTKYAILRKPFLKKYDAEAIINEQIKSKAYRGFISFGGTDQLNFTEKALKICLRRGQVKSLDVVIGDYYPYTANLEKIQKENPGTEIKIHSALSAQAICKVMMRSSFGICSASTVSYEYSAAGGILFVFRSASNQKDLYKFLIDSHVAYPASKFDDVFVKVKSGKFRKEYFLNRQKYFTAESDINLVNIFEKFDLERELSFIKAKKPDMMTYFKWVNDSEVRKNAINTDPILLEQHKKWFTNSVHDPEKLMLIFSKKEVPVGQVRVEKKEQENVIDVSIDKKFRNKGYAKILIELSCLEFSKTKKEPVYAYVNELNIGSSKSFLKANFEFVHREKINGKVFHKYVYRP